MIEKKLLFDWMRQLAVQIEQYHRCRNQQCYRYINPYSVLVTRDNRILLLDLEAESNAFVLRNMQKRAMREHFVKPVIHIRENTKLSLDLYGFGKTIQFILASTTAEPPLTGREERRLAKLIEKCLNENPKKQYENLLQVEKELPMAKENRGGNLRYLWILVLVVVVFGSAAFLFWHTQKDMVGQSQLGTERENQIEPEQKNQNEAVDQGETANTEKAGGPENGLDRMEDEADALARYLLRNTVSDNEEVIRRGEELHREVLRYLAAAYDRETDAESALQTYRELCGLENQEELLINVYVRRIALEMEIYQYGKEAVETGREAVERLPQSEELAASYLKAMSVCTELTGEECIGEADKLAERFPELRESKDYLKVKEKYGLEDGTAGEGAADEGENHEEDREKETAEDKTDEK